MIVVYKLLHGDPLARALLDEDRYPFPDAPPRWVRVQLYRYELAPLGADAVWERTRLGDLLPPTRAEDPQLTRYLTQRGWLRAE